MNLKANILSILKSATEPMDRVAIGKLCLAGTDKQIADQLYLLKKAREIIGKKESGAPFMYRLPTEADMPPSITPAEVLRARMEAEVDEIDLERIEEATEIIRMVEEIADEPKKLPPREVIERMIASKQSNVSDEALERMAENARELGLDYCEEYEAAKPSKVGLPSDEPVENGKQYIDVWPGPTLAERMLAANEMKSQPENEVSETVEDETEEPIEQEEPSFRVGVYNDGTMVLEKPHGALFELDKAQFAVLAEFARTVGWLPA